MHPRIPVFLTLLIFHMVHRYDAIDLREVSSYASSESTSTYQTSQYFTTTIPTASGTPSTSNAPRTQSPDTATSSYSTATQRASTSKGTTIQTQSTTASIHASTTPQTATGWYSTTTAGPGKDLCDPIDSCLNGQPGDYVIDPLDYSSFYVCIDSGGTTVPSDDSFACAASECFNPSSSSCEFEQGPSCYNECVNTCSVTCEDNALVASTTSCSQYIVCLAGNPVYTDCPEDMPYFDGSVCGSDPSNCCDVCSPRCSSSGEQVYDPYDCTRFYICDTIGAPNWDLHGQCDDGQFFDPVFGRCEIGATCENAC